MVSQNKNWGEAFYDHMLRYLGNPVSREIFRQDALHPHIQVLKFDNVFPDCKVFCSLGASNYYEILGGPAEVILPCDNGWDAIGGLLANSLFYLVQNRMELGRGVGISLERIAMDFAQRFGKAAIYFSNPFGLPSDFNIVKKNDEAGRMYLAFFISREEFDYFCDRGAEAFESLLERAKGDPFELHRHSSI